MKDEKKKRTGRRLPKEILLLFLISAAVAVMAYFVLRSAAGTFIWDYCEDRQIVLDELQNIQLDFLIENGSILASVFLFLVLFLFLLGQKLSYLQVIMDGIEALRIHRMDYAIPVKGKNELTDLAKSINYLSQTERELSEKEKQMKQEREQLIRALSHDLRTPLTSIRSYSELLAEQLNGPDGDNERIDKRQILDYVELVQRKADQMKELTDQLLENSRHRTEWMEDGKLLMEQLVMEWEEQLEDKFPCSVDLHGCPSFSGEIDIREFQRIFDNLYSNIEKYANSEAPVELWVASQEGRLLIRQKNKKKKDIPYVESHQIGLLSIKTIAAHYGGNVKICNGEENFEIQILLLEIS